MVKLNLDLNYKKLLLYFLCIIGLISIANSVTNINSCGALSTPGETYLLTSDILNSATSNCLDITANNVVLDCQGHTIDGNDVADYGIRIYRASTTSTYVTVKNCVLTDWDSAAIYVYRSRYNNITNINVSSNLDAGIYLYYGVTYNNLVNINASNNLYGIQINSNSGTNNVINSYLKYNSRGIYAYSSSNSNNYINNLFINNQNGIYLTGSLNNKIIENNFSNNVRGIYFASSSNSNIINTSYFYNNTYHLYMLSGSNNRFYDNKFFERKFMISSGNYFNSTTKGNYWYETYTKGYSELCKDLNSNGICDDPYLFSGVAYIDYLPIAQNIGQTVSYSLTECQPIFFQGEYILQNDIINFSGSKCFEIIGNNATLDCQGHTISGLKDNGFNYGIYNSRLSSENSSNTIKNCEIRNWFYNIYLGNSNTNYFYNLNLSNSDFGFRLYNSNNNSFLNVNIFDTLYTAFDDYGGMDNNFYNMSIYNNLDAINLQSSSNFIYDNLKVYNNNNGITGLSGVSNLKFSNSIFFDNFQDLYIYSCLNNSFQNVTDNIGKYHIYSENYIDIDNWNNISSIVLCNANNSQIRNLNYDHLDKNGTFILISSSSNITIENITLKNFYNGLSINGKNNSINNISILNSLNYGIEVSKNNNLFSNIYINNSLKGINIYPSDTNYNSFYNITLSNNADYGLNVYGWYNIFDNFKIYNNLITGVHFYNAGENNFSNSQVHNNGVGIHFRETTANIISNSEINNNHLGMNFSIVSEDNIISNSTILNNVLGDIYFYSSDSESVPKNNYFYLNSLNKNKIGSSYPFIPTDMNYFNSSFLGFNVGNYWLDFVCNSYELRGPYYVCVDPDFYEINNLNNIYDYAPLRNLDLFNYTSQCDFGSGWENCENMIYLDNLEKIRVNCSSLNPTESIETNATISLKNIEDNKDYFTSTINSKTGGWFEYNNPDFLLEDSGTYNLEVICWNDQSNFEEFLTETFIPFGTLNVSLINPNTNISVYQDSSFTFTSKVECVGGECGDVEFTLDPILGCEPIEGICTDACNSPFVDKSGTWYVVNGEGINYCYSFLESGRLGFIPNFEGSTFSENFIKFYRFFGEQVSCPSYDEYNRTVTYEDCLCDEEECDSSIESIFDFSSSFFTSPGVSSYNPSYECDPTRLSCTTDCDGLLNENEGDWYVDDGPTCYDNLNWDVGVITSQVYNYDYLGISGEEYIMGIDTDSLGNVYVSGISNDNLLLIKYDINGNQIFNKSIFGSDEYSIESIHNGIEIDSLDNIYIVNPKYDEYLDIVIFELIKYDSNGNQLWNLSFYNETEYIENFDFAIDNSNNVYVSYIFDDFEEEIITFKYDSNGNNLFNFTNEIQLSSYYFKMDVDSLNNIYYLINTYDEIEDIGKSYILKYDNIGNYLWNKSFGDISMYVESYDILIDSIDNFYVTGYKEDFSYTSKYDSNGNQLWNKSLETFSYSNDLAIDSSNNIYVLGEYYNSPHFYIIKYDSNGNYISNITEISLSEEYLYFALDPSNNIYLARTEDYDYVTTKYDSSFNELWTKTYDSYINVGLGKNYLQLYLNDEYLCPNYNVLSRPTQAEDCICYEDEGDCDEDLTLYANFSHPFFAGDFAKGVIPMNSGSPFYTITQNPMDKDTNSCLQGMESGSSCEISWTVFVNSTLTNQTYTFFTFADAMSYSPYISRGLSENIFITILESKVTYEDTLPKKDVNYGAEKLVIRVRDIEGGNTGFVVNLNGVDYPMTSIGSNYWEYIHEFNRITPITYQVSYDGGSLAQNSFTFYPDMSKKALPFESIVSGLIALILIIFGGFYYNRK